MAKAQSLVAGPSIIGRKLKTCRKGLEEFYPGINAILHKLVVLKVTKDEVLQELGKVCGFPEKVFATYVRNVRESFEGWDKTGIGGILVTLVRSFLTTVLMTAMNLVQGPVISRDSLLPVGLQVNADKFILMALDLSEVCLFRWSRGDSHHLLHEGNAEGWNAGVVSGGRSKSGEPVPRDIPGRVGWTLDWNGWGVPGWEARKSLF